MSLGRRKFIALAAGRTALGTILTNPLGKLALAASNEQEIKAIAFDAFPIFDPRPAFKIAGEIIPNSGNQLQKLWFNKVFAYTWLRTSGNQYKDFWHVMEDALRFSAASLELELTPEKQKAIMDSFLSLPVWPDVNSALEQLRSQGVRLAFLSNMTEDMLRANMQHNKIEEAFEFVLSTDKAQVFKPHPKAYRLGVDAFGLKKQEIAFTAFAGWDAVGASWFGYPSVWINRLRFPPENLDAELAASGGNLDVLTKFVR